MATIDLGKIKFTWKGAFATGTTYEADDVVSFGGSSWVYVNATSKAGSATGVPATSNSTHWDVMAEGTNVLTTSGDLMTHDGTNATRLARGGSGQVLTTQGTSLAFANQSGYKGWTVLQSNYGDELNFNQSPTASTTYGATGSRAWLADYGNNWIPEYAHANPSMGPVSNSEQGRQYHNYRHITFLNTEHELCIQGADSNSYAMNNILSGNGHSGYTIMNFCSDNGSMRDGDYFVRFWNSTHCMWALTKDGDLFSRGYNGYGQLGVGDTTNRYMWCKVPTLGPDATHAGVSCQIAGFHASISSCVGSASYNSCYAIDTSGRLFAWGYNVGGKLGNGNTTNQNLPVHISSMSNICMVSSDYGSCHIVDTSGNLFFAGGTQNEVDGGLSSGTLSSFTDTSQNNVYQILNNDGYYYTSRYAHAWYLNTDGHMYGIGGNATGMVGNGSTTQVGTWTRIGGSATYGGFVQGGNAYYGMIGALGGTPASPNTTVALWGYNGNGQIGLGNTTNQTSPTAPSTTTIFTHTVASTTSNTALSQTDVPLPTTAIRRIYFNRGMQGQSTVNCFLQDSKYRIWVSGYSNSQDYNKASSGNGALNNFRLDIAQEGSTSSISESHWAGSVETKINHIHGCGNAYGSEGVNYKVTTDGRIYAWGYNGQGQLDPAATYVGQWIQMRP